MHRRHEIREEIAYHLEIGEIKLVRLPDWALEELYGELSDVLRKATREAFDKPVELGMVHGTDAIAKLLWLAGDKTAPGECHPDSLRYRFGIKEPMLTGETPYFFNALHRPKTLDEAWRHLHLFWRL